MDVTTERRTQNEAMSRVANEAIEEAEAAGDGSSISFLCECTRPDCDRTIELTPYEYRRVRSNPRRFVVLHGHESRDIESVVEAADEYLVVEKHGSAGDLAEADDPRS
ncbi:MAG TPA: hypothetical protein VGN08_01615 [Solirubrobacteraceae bacterium]